MLLVQSALADGTGLWLRGTPDPTVSRDLEHVAVERLLSAGWTDQDDRAIQNLSEELEAVTPLLDEFDGELQIMLRLETALDAVTAIREQDRELVYQVLLFQGLAVQRYFQDGLAHEAGAAAYRIEIQGRQYNRPWVDAIAMAPDRIATEAEIPETPELLLFQELRAQHMLAPTSLIQVENLPDGTILVINGQEVPSDRARVLPGTHRATLVSDGEISVRSRAVLTPMSERLTLAPVALTSDATALADQLSQGERTVPLAPQVSSTLAELPQPVHLFVAEGRRTHHYLVEGQTAVMAAAARTSGAGSADGVHLRVLAGGSWVYDGDYLLQNHLEGAPERYGTVNAVAPMMSAGIEVSRGLLVAGVGVDGVLPVGEWHTLPSGKQTVRLRTYPHAEVGVGPARLTAGWLFPWHLGVGPRARYVIDEQRGLEVSASYVYGIGIAQSNESYGVFDPSGVHMAWAGVGLRR